jgi:hypothetical protein
MKTKLFQQPGKSKAELIKCLEKVQKKYQTKINDNNITINRIGDKFNIYAVKKILFLKYWVDANIKLNDGKISIEYDTNIPESKEKDFIKIIEKEINSACS